MVSLAPASFVQSAKLRISSLRAVAPVLGIIGVTIRHWPAFHGVPRSKIGIVQIAILVALFKAVLSPPHGTTPAVIFRRTPEPANPPRVSKSISMLVRVDQGLNLIAALDRPDSGDVVVAGTDVGRLSVRDAAAYRREHLGFVFQSYNLIPQLTALENVLLPMISKSRADRQRAAELLDRVGLADRHDHRPPQLSGGEQQRVAIARALANAPPLILADEPIGNLDDDTGRNVMDLLVRSCRERGTTLVLVSHNISAMQSADTTFVLKSGTLLRSAEVQPVHE
jgi:ABC-type lipoprotein export system ATPase subunit